MAKPGKQPKKDTSVTNQTNQANAPLASDIANANVNAAQDPSVAQQAEAAVKDPAQSAGGAETSQGEQGGASESSEGAQQGDQGGDNTTAENGTAATQEPAPEPTPEPTPAPAPAPTSAPAAAIDVLREKTDFEIYTDAIRAGESATLKNVLNILEDYQAVMGLNTVTSEATVNQQQGALWRAVKAVLGSAEDFTEGFQLLINFARQYGAEGAFQHHLLFRGFEHTKLNADASRAFQNILTVITTAAESKNPASVRKNIDLARAMESTTFSEESRSRVIGFFN